MDDNIILAMTTYPKRMTYAIRSLAFWRKYCPTLKMCLFLSLDEYPEKIKSIPIEVIDQLIKMKVLLIFRNGNEKAFKSYFAGLYFKNFWILQTDDDFYPSDKTFKQFLEFHNKYKNSFISWSVRNENIVGNGVLYNPSMLDKRYLSDMPLAVKYDLCDIWLTYWTKKAKIKMISNVGIIRNQFKELCGQPGLTNMRNNTPRKNAITKFMNSKYGKV